VNVREGFHVINPFSAQGESVSGFFFFPVTLLSGVFMLKSN